MFYFSVRSDNDDCYHDAVEHHPGLSRANLGSGEYLHTRIGNRLANVWDDVCKCKCEDCSIALVKHERAPLRLINLYHL